MGQAGHPKKTITPSHQRPSGRRTPTVCSCCAASLLDLLVATVVRIVEDLRIMSSRAPSIVAFLLAAVLCGTVVAFTTTQQSCRHVSTRSSCSSRQISSIKVAATEDDVENEDVLLYSSEWEDDDDNEQEQSTPWKKNARWNSLSPKVKLRIMQEAQERAIANKKKREPAQDKKRRTFFALF